MSDAVAEVEAFQQRLLGALLAADRRGAEAVVDDALFGGMDGVGILDDLLAPAMREIGRLWENAEIGIADEHLATAIVHTTLTRIYPRLVTAEPRSRGCVLLAGADGEEHVLGLRMIADVLEGGGFDVRNVGGSLPPDALTAAVRRHRPVVLGLADTMGRGALRASIAAARAADPQVAILLGGAGAAAELAGTDERVVVCVSARGALTEALRLSDA